MISRWDRVAPPRRESLLGLALCVTVSITACGVAVRSDRSTIGGGPEQATAQALTAIRATVVASAGSLATTSSTAGPTATPCDCEAGK